MKYIIKNKIISFGGASTVRDEYGNDLLKVKGKVFTLTRQKTICDLDKNPLFKVRNKLFNFFYPKVSLFDAEGKLLVTIKKKNLFSLRQDFEVVCAKDCDYDLSIQGDYIGRHYEIFDNGIPVAHVRRNYNLVKDSFWMETDLQDKAAFFVAFVIALDNYYDSLHNEKD